MVRELKTIYLCSLAAIIPTLTGLTATAQTPFDGGGSIPKQLRDKLALAPIVYEVSKSGNDQQKLMEVFAAVRRQAGDELTTDEFVRRLKGREHFEIRLPEKCRVCNGWKRLIPNRGRRGGDGKVSCKNCRGRGVELHPYIVKWKATMVTHKGDRRNPILAGLRRELGNHASALVWLSTARKYHEGELRDEPDARATAHAAYEEAVAKANASWRHDEAANSEMNQVHRQVIDDGLKGIADTAPRRGEKEALPDPVGSKQR